MYTPVAALYGEIGASTVEGRDRKIKLGFGQYMLRTSNGLLRAIFGRIRGVDEAAEGIYRGDDAWLRYAKEYD